MEIGGIYNMHHWLRRDGWPWCCCSARPTTC